MNNYKSANFNLDIDFQENEVLLTQLVHGLHINTRKLNKTLDLLSNHIPTIFDNECFNENKLSFKEEVVSTEIGHLFEHILIENLKLETEKMGIQAIYHGETNWDWNEETYGRFNIQIKSDARMGAIFNKCLIKSVDLMEVLLDSEGGYHRPQITLNG